MNSFNVTHPTMSYPISYVTVNRRSRPHFLQNALKEGKATIFL